MAVARVRFRPEGERRVLQAIRGIREESKRAAEVTRRESSRTTREQERNAERVLSKARSTERERERLDRRGRDLRVRLEREVTREIETQGRLRERVFRSLKRAAASASSAVGAGLRVAGTAALGAAAAAGSIRGRLSSFGGALGVRSSEQLVADTIAFERRFQGLRTRRQFGLSGAERESAFNDQEMRARINQTAVATGFDQGEILGALEVIQSRFARFFDDLAPQIDDMARAAAASGASLEDVAIVLGNIKNANPELTMEELNDVLFTMVDIGNRGSVEFGNFARAFGTLPGTFRAASGRQGMEAVREQLLIAQLAATGGATDAESATQVERLLRRLTTGRTQRRAQRLGIQLNAEDGTLLPLNEILRQFVEKGLTTNAGLEQILGADILGSQGAQTISRALQDEAFVQSLQGASAEGGRGFTSEFFANLNENNALATARQAQFAAVQDEGGARSTLIKMINENATKLAEFEAANLGAIEALGVFRDTLFAVAGASFLKNVLFGGGAAAAGSAGAAGATGAGGAAAGVGASAGAAAGFGILAGGAALAGAAYEQTQALTGSGALFRNGVPAGLRELARTRDREGTEVAAERLRRSFPILDDTTVTGRVLRGSVLPGLSNENINRLTRAIVEAVGGEDRRRSGGAARRN